MPNLCSSHNAIEFLIMCWNETQTPRLTIFAIEMSVHNCFIELGVLETTIITGITIGED